MDEEDINLVIKKLHPEFGGMILESWDFPLDLHKIPQGYLDFSRSVAEIDYVDIVMVANIQDREGSDHSLASIDCSKIQAFEHLGIEVDNVLASNDDLRQEVDAAIEAFH